MKSAVMDGKKVKIKVLSTKTADNVNVLVGRRNSSSLSGFNEVQLIRIGTISENTEGNPEYEFSQLDENEEVVVFVVDDSFNHLYGKTTIKE